MAFSRLHLFELEDQRWFHDNTHRRQRLLERMKLREQRGLDPGAGFVHTGQSRLRNDSITWSVATPRYVLDEAA